MAIKLFSFRQNYIISLTNGFLKRKFCSSLTERKSEDYDYLLFLDFEATCDKKKKIEQEIIEFPCLKVNSKTLVEEARFHHYVKPILNPNLTFFCTELTGIMQEMVDEAPTFSEVYHLFEDWRKEEGLTEENSLYVTSGDWDLGHMIRVQCAISNLVRPPHMNEWADIKKVFGNNNKTFFNNFADVMRFYGLQFEGRRHSGIDDCRNMYRIAKIMIREGIKFVPTSKIVDSKVCNISNVLPKAKINQKAENTSKNDLHL